MLLRDPKDRPMRVRFFLAGLLPLILAATAAGETAYRYEDATGTVVYSDSLPEGVSDYQVVELPESPPGDGAATRERIERMATVTERLREDRLEREEQRRAREPDPEPDYRRRSADDDRPAYGYPYGAGLPYRYPHRHDRPDRDRGDRDRHRTPDRGGDRAGDMRSPIRIPGFGEDIRNMD